MSVDISFISDSSHAENAGGELHKTYCQQKKPKNKSQTIFTKVANLSDQEGLLNTTFLAGSCNDIIAETVESAAEGAVEADKWLEGISHTLGALSLVKSVHWMLYEKARSIQHTMSMGLLTLLRGVKTTIFLSKQGAFSLSKISVNLGRIPVLNLVTSGLSIFATSFAVWDSFKEYRRLSAEQSEIKLAILSRPLGNSFAFRAEDSPEFKANQKLLHQAKLNLINDIVYLALCILILASLCTGCGFLALSGPFMLTLSLVSCSFNVYSWYTSTQIKNVQEVSAQQVRLKFART